MMSIPLLAGLVIVLLIVIVCLAMSLSGAKHRTRKTEQDNTKLSRLYQDSMTENRSKGETIARYQAEEQARVEQDAQEKEKQKRRIVTPKIKQAVFERDNKTCQICGISWKFLEDLCEGLGDYLLLESDHIVSVQKGGTGADMDNLQCLCWRCNRTKGGKRTNAETRLKITWGIQLLKPRYKPTRAETSAPVSRDAAIYAKFAKK